MRSGPPGQERPVLDAKLEQEQMEVGGYEACRLTYAEVNLENYIFRNIVSEGYAALETQRLTTALRQLPASASTAGLVAELGSGYGRN